MPQTIYLDNVTTMKPSEQAFQAALPFFLERFGSISAPHEMGSELIFDCKKFYNAIYELFAAKNEDQFVFCSSGAEAVSQVVRSVYKEMVQNEGKNHFIVRANDEAPAILACSSLEDEAALFSLAPVSENGYVTDDALIDTISARSAFFSTSIACALTGVLQPIETFSKICQERDIRFHIDVTHAIGKMPLDFHAMNADYITFNGEQFQALKGTGALFAKKEAYLETLIHGENEERQYRGVALNMPLFASLAEAANQAKEDIMLYATEVCRLRDMFEEAIMSKVEGARILFQDQARLPHISAISFFGVKSEALSYQLSRKGLFASFGGGQFQHIEKVLTAAKQEKSIAQTALSFSLSKETTETMIEDAVERIASTVKQMQKTSMVFFHDAR